MENMDSTVIATSLPAIAADIGTSPLTLSSPSVVFAVARRVSSRQRLDRRPLWRTLVVAIAIGVFMLDRSAARSRLP